MIAVEEVAGTPVAGQTTEVVERKGLGHPDTICDAVADAISVALCREYVARCGAILHHNIDKCLLAAGQVRLAFGGGEVLRPMELVVGDRATTWAGGAEVPVHEIAAESARRWVGEHLPHVDPGAHLRVRSVLVPGSDELAGLFSRGAGLLPANDTSAAVGHDPLTPTEAAVLGLERHLNGPEFKSRFPETGQDVKVMALRHGRRLEVAVAMPLLCDRVGSEAAYFAAKARLETAVTDALRGLAPGFDEIALALNALDEPGRGAAGAYLTLLGTSAEGADSGQVGRGNRVNGLICLNRPQGAEAAAGKNPVSHVGKIYNVLARELARDIAQGCEGVREATVLLLSRIGAPIDRPRLASVRLVLAPGRRLEDVRPAAEAAVEARLANLGRLCAELAEGRHAVC